MSSKTTINVPVMGGRKGKQKTKPVEGVVALLDLGGELHKFFIHENNLTDYRTGRRFGDLSAVKVERMARISTYTKTSDRQAAALLIARTVERIGIDKVREVMASHPTLNP